MKITMAESTGIILSHFTQSNQPEQLENLEMAETVEASVESNNSVELTSDDLCSEKDIPELPSEECAALDNFTGKLAEPVTTPEVPVTEDPAEGTQSGNVVVAEETQTEEVATEETQTEESTLVAPEVKSSGVQVNGVVCEKAAPAVPVVEEEKPKAVPAPRPVEKTAKETKREEKKKAKKGKDAEHMSKAIMQSLNGLETPEEKIAAMCKKYAELMGEHKSLQRESKTQTKQLSQIQRERDHLQSENGRALLAKSKLESLCRELQRHNRTIKEESLQRAREEDEKRKEISNKFQQTINEITTQMQENHTRNIKLKEENIELASKLKNLVEQYERREEHIEKLFKHKDLESQLYDAKLQQSKLALTEEQERNKREKEILLTDSVDSKRKLEMLTKQEAQLKAQLAVYTEKFEEFQSTLTKSNEVFQTFKQEMDKMTKKIKKLEKETNMWRVRWENSNKSLMSMVEEKTRHEKEMIDKHVKITRLEKLCRALQAERNALIGKARSTQGDVPAPTPPSDPVSDSNSTATPEPHCNGEVASDAHPDADRGAQRVLIIEAGKEGEEASSQSSSSETTEGKATPEEGSNANEGGGSNDGVGAGGDAPSGDASDGDAASGDGAGGDRAKVATQEGGEGGKEGEVRLAEEAGRGEGDGDGGKEEKVIGGGDGEVQPPSPSGEGSVQVSQAPASTVVSEITATADV